MISSIACRAQMQTFGSTPRPMSKANQALAPAIDALVKAPQKSEEKLVISKFLKQLGAAMKQKPGAKLDGDAVVDISEKLQDRVAWADTHCFTL